MYKIEFKLSIPLVLTSLSVVLLIFLFTLGAFEFYQDISFINSQNESLESSTEKIFKVDLQSSLSLMNSGKSIKGLGIDNAEVYVLKMASDKKGVASLFDKLKNKISTAPMKISNNTQASNHNISPPNYNAFLSQNEKQAMNDEQLRAIINSNQSLFRGCYNKMLIKDNLLSGIATITIATNGRGSSTFKGVGRTKVINELKECLDNQASKIDLSKIDLTKAIRFSLNFSS